MYVPPPMESQPYAPQAVSAAWVDPVAARRLLLEVKAKKLLRRTSNGLGLALLMLSVVPALWELSISASLPHLIGYFSDDPTGQLVFQIAATVPLFLGFFSLAVYIGGRRFRDVVAVRRVKPALALAFVGICLAALQLGDVATGLLNSLLGALGVHTNQPGFNPPSGVPGSLFYLFTVAVVPAFVEEYAMRGAAFGLLRRFGPGFAILASAILFGSMHGNFVQAPFAFVGGLALGASVYVCKSVWPAVIAHFLNNAFSCLFDIFPHMSGPVYAAMSDIGPALFLLWGILGAAYLSRRHADCLRPEPSAPAAPAWYGGGTEEVQTVAEWPLRVKMEVFFTSPLMIIALLMFLLNAILLVGVL